MKKKVLLVGVLACALSLPLVGCDGDSTEPGGGEGNGANQEQTGDFDAVAAYWGKWRGSVSTTGNTVYGSTAAKERMLDVNLEQDGTCTVVPMEDHADLLTDSGTWEGTQTEITLHLDGAGDLTLSVIDSATLEADASIFGIADFDTIQFDFYG